MTYLYLALVIFGMNLMPAFAPPTWTILVLFKLNSHIPAIPLIAIGAFAAGTGRYCLARATGLARNRISQKQRENLEAAAEVLNRKTSHHLIGLLLFALSPIPSAQLFEAAGLIGMRLLPLTLAFFAGRIVSYSGYVAGTATLQERGLGDVIQNSLKSVWGIALQIALLIGVYLLTKIDWKKYLKR